ncbi:helix-turn-helix transcriptional regulator [Paenibacillus sp. SYP-B4298]|uniref:helix-turn-helix transcriptional regulator n=1 Tax=Paenibacillus sp. SYP-B4298 TaxID=2996034 RepID=UPI0022DD3F2A|nr:WYL domain-containing protein [Paenibacillus sp. SYP-B4298]
MAKESFDKEIQFLRLLALTGGAYNRQQYAQRLGISVHTFDKTLRRLKDIVQTIHSPQELPGQPGRDLAEQLQFRYYESADPILLFLFRARSLKESESHRLSLLVAALQEAPLTALELLEQCCAELPAELTAPDEKTIRTDLKYLEEVGVIRKTDSTRPYRYELDRRIVTTLTPDEQLDLYDFVDIMANTQIPSVQGYLLRESLKKALRAHDETAPGWNETLWYKYHYHSRILDEAHLPMVIQAIEQRRRLRFLYFSPKSAKSYASQNTNPLFERESKGYQEMVLPLRVVYDHQYGRWYLLGFNGRRGIMKFRMEGLTQIEEASPVTEEFFAYKQAELVEKMRYSWLIDTGVPVRVRVRFFNPLPEPGGHNFVKNRVLLQGQWGTITEEDEDGFLYEITVNGITEIKPWLRSFGSSCEVLEPRELRNQLIEEWKELYTYYESVREGI